MLKLSGLITATATPFKENGEINTAVIPEYIDYLVAERLSGVFTCGTTGESSSLTVEERKCLGEYFARATEGKIRHIIHVGHNSIKSACELAEHAQSVKADAISAVCPSYFKVTNISSLVACCREIAAAAPATPFYYYHIPSFTSANLPMVEFVAEAGKSIPNFAGIKFTHFDLMEFQLCQDYQGGKYNMLFGRDEYYLGALAFGAVGAVGSTYNYMAPLFHGIRDAFDQNDFVKARELQLRVNKIICFLVKHGGMPTTKAFLRMRGIDTGPCRLPNETLSRDVEQEIYKAAVEIFPEFSKPI